MVPHMPLDSQQGWEDCKWLKTFENKEQSKNGTKGRAEVAEKLERDIFIIVMKSVCYKIHRVIASSITNCCFNLSVLSW